MRRSGSRPADFPGGSRRERQHRRGGLAPVRARWRGAGAVSGVRSTVLPSLRQVKSCGVGQGSGNQALILASSRAPRAEISDAPGVVEEIFDQHFIPSGAPASAAGALPSFHRIRAA